jgi:RNA polymerase sigma-70 factor, ECF subfamily
LDEKHQQQQRQQQIQTEITVMLKAWSDGSSEAANRLLPLVYDGLRKVAANYLRKERPGHTLQPTALVHEAYLKLVDISQISWQDRAHFYAAASQMMRNILVDHARARRREKRGGDARQVALDEAVSFADEQDFDLLALEEALQQLAAFDPQQAKIVELRFFGGLTIEETALVLKISPATVKREWTMAKVWLYRKLNR